MADDLSNLWANLTLSEGEDGEIEINTSEVQGAIKRGQSCVVGKLVSDRMVSKETIKTTLICWWRLKGTFTFKILGSNLFLIEFESAQDKIRVLEGRPWVFEGNLFMIEDFDGHSSPSEFTFEKASFWVRMLNLPLACMGREVGIKLGGSLRQVEEVDTDCNGIGWGEFLRVKIMIDLYKPLSRGRMLKFDGKTTLIGFKYERLPTYCYHCGVICHGIEGCLKRSSLRNKETIQFGPWLRATSPTRKPEKGYERHTDHAESSRFSPSAPDGRTRRDDHQEKMGYGRKRKTTYSDEDVHGGGGPAGPKVHKRDEQISRHKSGGQLCGFP